MLKSLELIADAFIWDSQTFPRPYSHRSGLRWYLSCAFQLIANFANLVFWRLFIFRIVLHFVGKHRLALGRCLVAFATIGISTVVISIYTCLLPLRISRWLNTNSSSELYWLLVHAFFGHLLLLNISVHFACGVLRSPGIVDPVDPFPPELPFTMCSKCLRPRPLRAHHCSVCGVCVLRMDHHCPWLNNCVGLRTHRHFFLFLAHLAVGIVYLYAAALGDFVEHSRAVCEADSLINCLVHTTIRALYRVSLLVLAFALCLLVWHGGLIGRGETSVERHHNRRLSRLLRLRYHLCYRNPFDFGQRTNWLRFLGLLRPADTHKPANAFVIVWRAVKHVLLPLDSEPYDGEGWEFETNEPDAERVFEELKHLDED